MNPLIINSLTFVAVFLTIFAANAALSDVRESERRRLKKRLDEEVRNQQRERVRAATRGKDFSQIAAAALAENRDESDIQERIQLFFDQSGLEMTIPRLALLSAISGAVVGVAPAIFTQNFLLTLIVAALGATLPTLYVYYKRHVRLEKLRAQLPDAFGLMGRVMRSGQTISQALQGVAEEFSQPISLEFLYCYEQMNLGLSPEAALRGLGRRTGILEMKIFVLAMLVQRQTGGNLAALLDKLAFVVRERFRIRGMIGALTAQGRFQGTILVSLPIFMFFLLMLINREYESVLLEHPLLVATAIGLLIAGGLWIRKIVNFDW